MLLKAEGLYVFGSYRLDARERQLLRNGEIVSLPPKAFDVLVALVSRAGHLVTKEELLAEVWAGTFVEDANLSYTISLVRKALGEEADPIETVPKVGYRFLLPVSLANGVTPAIQPAATNWRMPWRASRTWHAAIILLGVLGATAWIVITGRVARNSVPEPTTVPVTSFGGLARMPRLSPDGKRVAYQWDGRRRESDAPNWDVYVQSVDGGDPLQLTSDPAPEFFPVWSPDGERIAFVTGRGDGRYVIQVKPAMGGPAQTVTPTDVHPARWPIDWSVDGNTLSFTVPSRPPLADAIALLSLDSGQVRTLTSPPTGTVVDRVPRFSPDGLTVAFLRNTTAAGPYGDLYTIRVADGREQKITSGSYAIQGESWTADGRELVFSSSRTGHSMLWRIAADGSEADPRPVVGVGTDAYYPSVSLAGNRLAYYEEREDEDIWRVSVSLGHDGIGPGLGNPNPVRGSTRMDASPQVSPDGQHLVFASRRLGDQGIWISDTDGLNAYQIASFPGYPAGSPRWSPAGTRIVFDASIAGHADIFVVGRQGGRLTRLTSELAENIRPSWSRDEKWIYFSSNRTGRSEVWKVPSGGGVATQVTRNGGYTPFESNDGFIYYVGVLGREGIWRVPAGGGGKETLILQGPFAGISGYWALLPNGIYFATQETNAGPALVQYFDLSTGQTIRLGYLDAPVIPFNPYFSVSADGKSLFYVKAKPTTSDIMLVKNFR